MKTIMVFKKMLISLLFFIPVITTYAQSGLIVKSYTPPKMQLNFSDINLQNNLFRWDPIYLQALSNQKVLLNQHVPYLNLYTIKVRENTFPKTHVLYQLNTHSMTFMNALLETVSTVAELWYEHYHGATGCYIPMAIPTREGPTIETRFINCGGRIEPYQLY